MTYLEMVNDILLRLRESTVASVSTSTYSELIGAFCNDAKRQVEDAWDWTVLRASIPITTESGTTLYTVTGSGMRHRGATVNDATNDAQLQPASLQWILDQQQMSTVQTGQPTHYAWHGTDNTDSKVELFPTPNGAYTLYFNMVVPQTKLTSDGTIITVPSEPVILGSLARALVERGEDAGFSSGEAYGLFKSVLSDYISIEKERTTDYDCFIVV